MPSADTGVVVGEALGHRYLIRREFGRGGMATVFLAEDLRLGKSVAIKFPRRDLFERPDARERFEREIRNLTQLDHRAIVKILDVGEHGDRPFVVMQYLAGGTLADRLALKSRRLPAPISIVGWITEIASALDFTHAHGFVHRDVKPSNILFDEAGNAYLSDFGIAKAIGSDTTSLTNWDSSSGTPLYMAPEITDDAPIGPAYDQYSLAVVVFQTLTGRLPHEAETGPRLMLKRATEPPFQFGEFRPDLPEAVAAVVMRALERVPERRFPSCRAFSAAFRGACGAVSRERPAAPAIAPPQEPPAVQPAAPPAEPPAAPLIEVPAALPEVPSDPVPVPIAPERVIEDSPPPAPPAPIELPPAPPELPLAPPDESSSDAPPVPAALQMRTALLVALVLVAGVALTFWATHRRATTTPRTPDVDPNAASAKSRVEIPRSPEEQRLETLSRLARAAPPVPVVTPDVAGDELARAFLVARAAWQGTLGEFEGAVLASPELSAWTEAADAVAKHVAAVDGLALHIDEGGEESGTLRADGRRATLHGALSLDRIDLLRIEVSQGVPPSLTALPAGRFLAEVVVPEGVDDVVVTFTRLDHTVLGTVDVRVPELVAAPLPVVKDAPAAAPTLASVLGAAFTRVDEPAAGRAVWLHVKSGLRFVEVDVPRSAVAALPRFAQDATYSAAPADSSYLLLVAETECTNDAWRKWKPTGTKQDEGGDLPVVSVGGADIVAFCAEMGLELPYAAEWRSFALAAGESDAAATPERLGEVAWFKGNSGGARHPVKQLQPNAFGLYDVQGNVWEITLRDDEQWASVVSGGEIAPVVRPYLGGSCNCSAARCQIAKPEPAKDGPGSTRGFRPVYRPAWNR